MGQGIKDTLQSFGILWLRVLTGLGMAYHGYGKVFSGSIEGFAKAVASMGFPMPEVFAWAAALSELVGGLFLVLGLFTRPAALFIFGTMFVAAFIAHGSDPFSKKELALAYLTASGALFMLGSGALSMDNWIKSLRSNKL